MPDVVVDIGNSRIKLCRCDCKGLVLPVRGIADDQIDTFVQIVSEWNLPADAQFAISTTNPSRLQQIREKLVGFGYQVIAIDSPFKVPIAVRVDFPEKVGIDRLLNTIGARILIPAETPAIVVDAGSAVTVDLLSEDGSFVGGTIFPGARLMALSLNEHTAKLPLVEPFDGKRSELPAKNTEAAMKEGILYAVTGGIDAIVRELATKCWKAPRLFLTGGDMTPELAGMIQSRFAFQSELRPTLTLEGIRVSAELLE